MGDHTRRTYAPGVRARLENPPWLTAAAWGAFLSTVPSAVWRVLMIAGLVPGTEALRAFELEGDPAAGTAYVLALSAVQLTAGALSLGLIAPWGERIGRWWLPVWLPVVLAVSGGVAVTAIFDVWMLGALTSGVRPDAGLVHGVPLAIMVAAYAPIFGWGPLVLVSALGYWRRRMTRRPEDSR